MAYFRECEYCGATLDPGEKCDCRKARAARKPEKQTASTGAGPGSNAKMRAERSERNARTA